MVSSHEAAALLWAAVRLQGLSDRTLSTLIGLTAHWARLPPLVCREAQGAAPAVAAVPPQHLQAARHPWGPAAAPHLPAQRPGGGEAPAGQTHQCDAALLLLLLFGGGEDGQGGPQHTHWRREGEKRRSSENPGCWRHLHSSSLLSTSSSQETLNNESLTWFSDGWTERPNIQVETVQTSTSVSFTSFKLHGKQMNREHKAALSSLTKY